MVVYPQSVSSVSDLRAYDIEAKNSKTYVSEPFLSESDLVNKFSTTASINKTITGYVTELDSGNGIADIVLYKKRKDWEKSSTISSIKPQWAYALTVLPYRKLFSQELFTSIACTSQSVAVKVLSEYAKAGYCERKQGAWMKVKQPRPPIVRMLAIEAKLRDWKRALQQATRYLDFAHQSWVLLDEHYCGAAIDNIEEFKRRNIGLITISSEGGLAILSNAVSSTPRSPMRYWGANVLIMQGNSS